MATTDLPVPGPPSIIITFFAVSVAFVAIDKTDSYTSFWSSINTNSWHGATLC